MGPHSRYALWFHTPQKPHALSSIPRHFASHPPPLVSLFRQGSDPFWASRRRSHVQLAAGGQDYQSRRVSARQKSRRLASRVCSLRSLSPAKHNKALNMLAGSKGSCANWFVRIAQTFASCKARSLVSYRLQTALWSLRTFAFAKAQRSKEHLCLSSPTVPGLLAWAQNGWRVQIRRGPGLVRMYTTPWASINIPISNVNLDDLLDLQYRTRASPLLPLHRSLASSFSLGLGKITATYSQPTARRRAASDMATAWVTWNTIDVSSSSSCTSFINADCKCGSDRDMHLSGSSHI
jgi:hypothetical protein